MTLTTVINWLGTSIKATTNILDFLGKQTMSIIYCSRCDVLCLAICKDMAMCDKFCVSPPNAHDEHYVILYTGVGETVNITSHLLENILSVLCWGECLKWFCCILLLMY